MSATTHIAGMQDTQTGAWPLNPQGAARLRNPLLAGGIALAAVSLALGFMGSIEMQLHFKFLYLTCFFYCVTISLGALFFVLIHHLVAAKWSIVVRRIAEALTLNFFPLLFVLYIPLLFWLPDIYPWARPDHAGIVGSKAVWLSAKWWTVRTLIYFALWTIISRYFYNTSVRHDETGDDRLLLRLRSLSAPSMLIFALTLTLAGFDFYMSLTPKWYSSIFGVYIFAGCLIGIYASMILMSLLIGGKSGLGNAVTVEHYHDLGKMLFAFVVFWAYIGFSQFLLIWMANTPEEQVWYIVRWENHGWHIVSWLQLFAHFIFPFFYLLSRSVKRTPPLLALGAVYMLALHFMDHYWMVMPAFSHQHLNDQFPLNIMDFLLPIGFLAVCVWNWLRILSANSIVAYRDPYLSESLEFQNM